MNIRHISPPPKRLSIGAVLLAAGAGSRLGYKPKSLLELDGVPLIHRQLHTLSGAGVAEIVVVLGHYAGIIEAAVRACPVAAKVQIVTNPCPDDGQPSSVRIGLQTLDPQRDAVIVALADQPLLDVDDVTALIDAFQSRSDAVKMVVPRVSGSPGNPVIFDSTLAAAWLQGDTNVMGRAWRENNPKRMQWFDSASTHFRVDIDTVEDINEFIQSTGQDLRWPQALA